MYIKCIYVNITKLYININKQSVFNLISQLFAHVFLLRIKIKFMDVWSSAMPQLFGSSIQRKNITLYWVGYKL